MYGFQVDDLNHSKTLPWGTQFEETHRAWELDYWAKSYVWDGIVMDGIVGTVKGLGTFVGFQGLDAAGKAWVGLAKLATGVAISTSPLLYPFWLADEKDLSPWLRDSRKAMKETGKALVAWDEWGKNPARAAGAVTFNVVTTVATGGAGSATKAGTVAKVLSATGKAGRLIDPITYISKAGSYGKFKVGELFTHFNKVDGAFPKIDDVVWKDLPKADVPGVRFPHPQDTVRLLDDALGRPQYYDKTTNQLLDHTGAPKQDLTTVPKGSDHPLAEVPKHEQVPAGVGAHTPHNSHTDPGGGSTGHGGTDTTPTGGHASGDHTPTAGAHGDGPTSGHHPPGVGHGDSASSGGDHGDGGTAGSGGHAAASGEPDRLAVALDREVDLDQLGMPVVWRMDDAPLYRSDNRPPEAIFESGFEALDTSRVNLVEYVEESEASAFVSTSYRDDIGDDFGGKFTYEIDVPGGIDVNTSMGPHPLDYEKEIAFPGGIRPEYIKGARPYNYATGEVGDLIPNPNYRPEAERVG
ncbi:scabin-related ADP-ribosyltransferase [Streptomyces sp. MJM1172]|uniref:scabin-related ADP-ribosyltransferase n=1 Tax=Streptomyces sp. MJM1172 TaxID=1703926 RepID=UPI00093E6D62|nr:hypothetical protein [Streptomyces sp. MJM1172]